MGPAKGVGCSLSVVWCFTIEIPIALGINVVCMVKILHITLPVLVSKKKHPPRKMTLRPLAAGAGTAFPVPRPVRRIGVGLSDTL